MRHQSTEKLARNLEQLLSGPKVGAETKSAPTPAGTGAGGGGGGTGTGGVERDQSKGGEGEGGHDSSSASPSEQEVKSSEQESTPIPIPSNVFSFARITQVRHSSVLISSFLIPCPTLLLFRFYHFLFHSPPPLYFPALFLPTLMLLFSPLPSFLTSILLHSLLFSHLFSSSPFFSHIYSPPLPSLLLS